MLFFFVLVATSCEALRLQSPLVQPSEEPERLLSLNTLFWIGHGIDLDTALAMEDCNRY